MWPRVVEAMLGVWLLLSPLVFSVGADHTWVWAADLGLGGVALVCSLMSYWPPARYAYLGTLAVGLVLVLLGWVQARPVPPWHQNHIGVGLLLAMFAILPGRVNLPPRPWRGQLGRSSTS